jgi:hypothetical protein
VRKSSTLEILNHSGMSPSSIRIAMTRNVSFSHFCAREYSCSSLHQLEPRQCEEAQRVTHGTSRSRQLTSPRCALRGHSDASGSGPWASGIVSCKLRDGALFRWQCALRPFNSIAAGRTTQPRLLGKRLRRCCLRNHCGWFRAFATAAFRRAGLRRRYSRL